MICSFGSEGMARLRSTWQMKPLVTIPRASWAWVSPRACRASRMRSPTEFNGAPIEFRSAPRLPSSILPHKYSFTQLTCGKYIDTN